MLSYLHRVTQQEPDPHTGCLYFRNMCLEDYIILELHMWWLYSWYIIELLPESDFYFYYFDDLKFFLSGKSF